MNKRANACIEILRQRNIKGGHRSKLASLRFCVNVATERRQHTQVEFVWITQRFRTIAVFPINWERLDAGVFTSMLLATKRKSRTTRETKGGHRSKLASLRFCVNAATERRQHTQVEFVWITQRFRTIAVFPINWERLDAGVFTSMLPATKRKSRTTATRETDVISERKHCSRKRRHTHVDFRTRRKCADKTQTIARKRWHGARKRKRSNVRSTCGRLNVISERKHCSRKRRHTQVDFRTRRKCADKTQTIARKRWHGARKRKRSNVRSTCGRL